MPVSYTHLSLETFSRAVIPALEKVSKEGQAGYKKINQYTRYGTVGLAMIQAFFIALWLESPTTDVYKRQIYITDVLRHLPKRHEKPGWSFNRNMTI